DLPSPAPGEEGARVTVPSTTTGYLPNVETPRAGGNPRWGRLRSGDNGSSRKGSSRRYQGKSRDPVPREQSSRSQVFSPRRRRPHRGFPPARGVSTLAAGGSKSGLLRRDLPVSADPGRLPPVRQPGAGGMKGCD